LYHFPFNARHNTLKTIFTIKHAHNGFYMQLYVYKVCDKTLSHPQHIRINITRRKEKLNWFVCLISNCHRAVICRHIGVGKLYLVVLASMSSVRFHPPKSGRRRVCFYRYIFTSNQKTMVRRWQWGHYYYISKKCVRRPHTHNNCVGPMINGEEGTLTRREYITSQVASVTPAHNV